MQKILASLASAAALGAATLAFAPSATAGENTGLIHNSPDPGYSEPIKVRCTDNTFRWIGTGLSSSSPGKCPYSGNISQILPAPGEAIRCTTSGGASVVYTSAVNVGANIYFYCVNSLA